MIKKKCDKIQQLGWKAQGVEWMQQTDIKCTGEEEGRPEEKEQEKLQTLILVNNSQVEYFTARV